MRFADNKVGSIGMYAPPHKVHYKARCCYASYHPRTFFSTKAYDHVVTSSATKNVSQLMFSRDTIFFSQLFFKCLQDEHFLRHKIIETSFCYILQSNFLRSKILIKKRIKILDTFCKLILKDGKLRKNVFLISG